MPDINDKTVVSQRAISAIPLCASLVFKHREIEAVMWELISTLAEKARPTQGGRSIYELTDRLACVKFDDRLRVVYHGCDVDTLRLCVEDFDLNMPKPVAVLIGDVGLDGHGRVLLVVGKHQHGYYQLKNIPRALMRLGIC